MNLSELRTKIGRVIYGTNYKIEEGVVTWNGFEWGAGDNPAETSAINYSIVCDLRKTLGEENFESAIEIGAGYGRVTPWLDIFAEEIYALEPNSQMLGYIENHYPHITTFNNKAQSIPLPDNSVDVVFTRSVLHHIPMSDLNDVCDELERIRTSKGVAILMEDIKGSDSKTHHPRPVSRYNDIFDSWELSEKWSRETPGFEYSIEGQKQVIVFKMTGVASSSSIMYDGGGSGS